MKQLKAFFCLIVAAMLASCGQKAMNPEELYNKTSTGVVLIVNYFYYSITLPSGDVMYFTGVNRNGDLENFTFDEEQILQNRVGSTGTGFFISTDGELMTNRHVASPQITKEEVKPFLKGFKRMMKSYYAEKREELRTQYFQYEGVPGVQKRIAEQFDTYGRALENIDDMDMNEADVETHSQLSIIYNDSHVTKAEDMKPCNLVAVSEDEDVDLAIIQLDDATTPEGAYVFRLRDEAVDEPLTLDQKLYMIGYNYGFDIAKTAQGIRSQIYSGNVTQKGDGQRILYSISSLPGSSGSPVVDEYGNLVAVNYAGMSTTQNFNYGIPSKKVRQFLKEN